MAGNQNASMAIDHETKAKLKEFTDAYERKTGKRMTAKDFVTQALDYFDRTGVNIDENQRPSEDLQNHLQAENERLRAELEQSKRAVSVAMPTQIDSTIVEKLDTILRGVVDVNLKTTAIGQGVTSLSNEQKETRLLIEARTEKKKKDKELTIEDIMGTYYTKKMADVFKVWRTKKGLSLHAVAQESNINYNALKNLEAGKDISVSNFLRYLNYILANDESFVFDEVYKTYAKLGTLDGKRRTELWNEYRTIIPGDTVEWEFKVTGTYKGETIVENFWIGEYSDAEEKVKELFLKAHKKATVTDVLKVNIRTPKKEN